MVKKISLISGVIFILLISITTILEIIFPYSFIENYSIGINYSYKNYYIISTLSYLLSLSLFCFCFQKLSVNLNLNLIIKKSQCKFIFLLIIIGCASFFISKVFLMRPQIDFTELTFCNFRLIRHYWIQTGSVDQSTFYLILSPIGMLFTNAYIIILYLIFCEKKENLPYNSLNYFFIAFPVLLQFIILSSKNGLINVIFFSLIFLIINYLNTKTLHLKKFFIIFTFCFGLIITTFILRGTCTENLNNSEFEERSIKNFKNEIFQKKNTGITVIDDNRKLLVENAALNYFIYYATHSKINSDFYFSKMKTNRKAENVYIKKIFRFLSRSIIYNNFNFKKSLKDNYNINKIRGGYNLHYILWLDYGVLGMFFFNFIFFMFLLLNNLIGKWLKCNSDLSASINIMIITVIWHQLLFSNLFIGITTFNSIFLFFLLFIFFISNIKNNNA